MKHTNIVFNRYFISMIILLFINLTLSSCYSIRETTIDNDQSLKIYKVITLNNDTIDFNYSKSGYASIIEDSIVCIKKDGFKEVFPKSVVKTYFTEKFDYGKTVLTVLGTAVLISVVLVVLVVWQLDGRIWWSDL